MIEVRYYQDSSGSAPLTEWLSALRDKVAKQRIVRRLSALAFGNFGDSAPVGGGVIELRVHVGAGYRVYCARHGEAVVLLLCGGDKRSQAKDIQLAQALWARWKQGQRS